MGEQKEEIKKQPIGAWKQATKKGEVIKFTINGQKYAMFVNAYKEKNSQPDFKIYEDNWVAEKPVSVPENFKPISDDDLF